MPDFDLDSALVVVAVHGDGTPLLSTCCGLKQQVRSWESTRHPSNGLHITGQCPCGLLLRYHFTHTGYTRDGETVNGSWSRIGADCPVCAEDTAPWECSWYDGLNDRIWLITQPHQCHAPDGENLFCRVKEHYELDPSANA